MFKCLFLCLVLVFTFARFAKTATVEECINSAVEEAIHICSIQNKLMIAGLSCENAKEKYNKFARKYKPLITNNDRVLKDYFRCRSGKKAIHHMDKIITRIANIASGMNSENHTAFCEDAEKIFAILEKIESKKVGKVAIESAYIEIDDLKDKK